MQQIHLNITPAQASRPATKEIKQVTSEFLKHFDNKTLDVFLHQQNYTNKELIQFCKAARINYSHLNKEDLINEIVTLLYTYEETIHDKIELAAARGDLVIMGGSVIVGAVTLIANLYRKLRLQTANNKLTKGDGFVGMILAMILMSILSTFSSTSQSEKDYAKSKKSLGKSWQYLKDLKKKIKSPRRTSKVMRMDVIAKGIQRSRCKSKQRKLKQQLWHTNTLFGKLKKSIFGGPTAQHLEKEIRDIDVELSKV